MFGTINFCEDLYIDACVDIDFNSLDGDQSMMSDPMIGDHVSCKVKNRIIVGRHEKDEYKITLTIIGAHVIDENTIDYVAHIPDEDISKLESSFRIRNEFAELYGIRKKYIGDHGITLKRNNIFKIIFKADGMPCKKCDEFYDKAEPNQEDGSLLCYLCRQNPFR